MNVALKPDNITAVLWFAWTLAALSCGIITYNWYCVSAYRRTGKAPGFVHFYGGLPGAAAIGMGWIGLPTWLFWLPVILDPGSGLYLIGLIRYLLVTKD